MNTSFSGACFIQQFPRTGFSPQLSCFFLEVLSCSSDCHQLAVLLAVVETGAPSSVPRSAPRSLGTCVFSSMALTSKIPQFTHYSLLFVPPTAVNVNCCMIISLAY